MRRSDTGDLWWKNAVFYCADVETFYDANGDGCGDIRGMTDRIEYLFDLGVTCLWLMPFYPTARKDDGYDITDFFGVDPRLGTHGDFVELVRTAKATGIRVIIDFVMNHTSDAHPWFKSARRSTDDPFRDFYVWSATKPKSSRKDVVFPDEEDSLWQLDTRTDEWFLHHFLKHQPDLNVANPKVQEEISRTLGFWLELGVSGFRVDAVPFLFAKDAAPGDPGVFDPNQYLGDVRNFVTRRLGDAVLLGEVNLPYKDQLTFFGGPDGDGLNMQFDFIGMQAMYLSLARGDARPIAKALQQRPALDLTSQWANFVRNHDELTLDKLKDTERQEVFDAFGPEPDMQLYGRGLRRRLPSMLGGDQRRMRMVYSLAFSLPGTPVLFYGEEIGMAENLIYTYRQQPEIGWSTAEVLEQPNPAVLAHVCREKSGWAMVALHNFGADRCIVPIQLEGVPSGCTLIDLLDGLTEHKLDSQGSIDIGLDGYGYRWLRLRRPEDQPII
jgi:trehalose synthase